MLMCTTTSIIYLLTCTTCTVQYVRQTSNSLRERYAQHTTRASHPEPPHSPTHPNPDPNLPSDQTTLLYQHARTYSGFQAFVVTPMEQSWSPRIKSSDDPVLQRKLADQRRLSLERKFIERLGTTASQGGLNMTILKMGSNLPFILCYTDSTPTVQKVLTNTTP